MTDSQRRRVEGRCSVQMKVAINGGGRCLDVAESEWVRLRLSAAAPPLAVDLAFCFLF